VRRTQAAKQAVKAAETVADAKTAWPSVSTINKLLLFNGANARPMRRVHGKDHKRMAVQTKATGKTLPDAPRGAAAFQRMRELQRTEVAGDYVKLIADLIAMIGQAWLTDVAEHPGASHGAAAKVVHQQREGLVESRPYRSIFSTKSGASVAAMSRDPHRDTKSNYLCLPREAVCHIAAR
jgi:hypothetical protein